MAVSIVVKGEFVKETVIYDTKTKAYVAIRAVVVLKNFVNSTGRHLY